MKSVVKNVAKYSLIVLLSLGIVLTIFVIVLFVMPSKVKFDIDKIKYSNATVAVYDKDNRIIKDNTNYSMYIKLHTLNMYTKDAFISIEDKNFYSHHGLNYTRIFGAMIKNLTAFKLKEGASTISQQLIKNTHLTNEKTFSRKINEIKLTKELEKNLSKDEILEYYLNIIYFGDNCYGIESASTHYFSKSSKDLTLGESAMLAGMIKSPNTYSPIKNIDKATVRRNVVLKEMLNDNKISFDEYNKAKLSKIETHITNISSNNLNTYISACIDEASKILNMPQKQLAIGEYKIYSFQDRQKQTALQNSFDSFDNENDYAGISIGMQGKIEAYVAKSNIKLISAQRQPGSTIKPILVYSPALNQNIVSPLTQINDEQIDINGYTPKNVNGKFNGYVTVRDSVAKSLNVPAVKVLSYVGIDCAKNYAQKCGIKFDESDNHLGIALGGMAYGVTLKDLVGSYTIFNDGGDFFEPKFVNYITDGNGKIVYRKDTKPQKVIRDDTAYLMTDMLKTCAKSGTGRKLGDLKFDVATKTGTVGKSFNTDAYNIAYTSQDIVGVWIGNADNKPIDTVGGGLPTDIVKNYMQTIYYIVPPADFEVPSSVYFENIDGLSLQNEHVLYRANDYIPQKYIINEIFSKFNIPKEKSNKFISVPSTKLYGKIENDKAVLTFDTYDYLIYEVYKNDGDSDVLISSISGSKGECKQVFDINKRTSYFVITKIKNFADNTEIISDKSNIIELMPKNQGTSLKINNSKWYI